MSSLLSHPHPQHRQYQPPSACLRGLPRSGPGRSPTSPSLSKACPPPQRSQCHLAHLLPPEAALETKFLPSPKYFLASSSLGRSQGTTLASDSPCSLNQEPPSHRGMQSPSPCQCPHPGSEAAPPRASHSFPRKQEADFQGGASGDQIHHPPATQATKLPQLPTGSTGRRGCDRLERTPYLLRKVPSGPAPAHLSPSLSALNFETAAQSCHPLCFLCLGPAEDTAE